MDEILSNVHIPPPLALSQEAFGGVDRRVGRIWSPVEEERPLGHGLLRDKVQAFLETDMIKNNIRHIYPHQQH